MKKLFFLCLIFVSVVAISQDSVRKEKPVEVKWSGFILNQMFYDSRKNVEALDGMVLLFPQPKDTARALGQDLNAVPNLNLLSFASRLRTNITGPDAFGASTSGYIEFDFTSRGNSASVRFRQGWAKFSWPKYELLVGRTWHPLVSTDVTPWVNALSWGAPFQPFNRSDQVTMARKIGKTSIIGSLIFQNDYTSNGPVGKTYLYQTNSLCPELHAQVKYNSDNFIIGAAADYKKILPRTYTTSPITSLKYTTSESFNSLAFLAYGSVKTSKLTISAKTIYAANISENLMAGAYGISSYDSITGHEEYSPYRHFFIWGNVVYGNKLKGGIFGGYLKNLGASENLVTNSAIYGLGEKIESMYRITPVVSYSSGKITIAGEVEYNMAAFGRIDYADKGKIKDTENINSTRVLLTMYYFF